MRKMKLNTQRDLAVVYEAGHPLTEAQLRAQLLERKILDDYLQDFEKGARARLRARHRSVRFAASLIPRERSSLSLADPNTAPTQREGQAHPGLCDAYRAGSAERQRP